ncbi:MAG: twin-arginine translocation signal domain-containing protein, partial [Kiritimatiellae bacterium]|nr:twin-arginine translocation signal domain-containing protein [Kiritimatiellia bacterium]
MDTNRREFLKGTAWMGAAAVAAGCMSAKQGAGFGVGGSMFGFAAKPMKKIRVGVAG